MSVLIRQIDPNNPTPLHPASCPGFFLVGFVVFSPSPSLPPPFHLPGANRGRGPPKTFTIGVHKSRSQLSLPLFHSPFAIFHRFLIVLKLGIISSPHRLVGKFPPFAGLLSRHLILLLISLERILRFAYLDFTSSSIRPSYEFDRCLLLYFGLPIHDLDVFLPRDALPSRESS